MPANNSAKQNTVIDLSIIKFSKRSFFLVSSSIIRLAVQLTIIFLFARRLSVTDYGLYQSVWLYINVISIVGLFGLPALILSSTIANISQWIKVNKKLFFIMVALLNVGPILYVLLATNNYNLSIKLSLIAICITQNASIIAETIAIKNQKEKLILTTNIIFLLGYLLCHLALLYNSYSLQFLLQLIIALFTVKAIVLVKFATQSKKNTVVEYQASLGKQWFYLGIYDVSGVLAKWIDKWVILSFISITQFAMYVNGSYEIPVFGLMLSAVGSIMLVDLAGEKIRDTAIIKKLFEHSSLLLASIVFPSFCFLLFYSTEFFTFIFSNRYADAIPVFIISLFILPVRITNFTAVLQVSHRNDIIVKGAILDLLIAVILMAVLYPFLQLKGLALAFVLSTYFQAGYYLWHTSKLINKKISYFFPFKRLFYIMLISVAATGIFYYTFSYLSFPGNIIVGIIICGVMIVSLLLFYFKTNRKKTSEV